ncbi:MAG TPA: type II/IV secretion system protein, partial [Leptolyngbyaceae cyanobacterium]
MTQSSSQRRALVVRNDFSPFGNKLIAAGYVDIDQMQQALVETRKSGRPLTEILESMTGRQLPPDLLRQYKKQQLFEL